jgi:hypothetical protein
MTTFLPTFLSQSVSERVAAPKSPVRKNCVVGPGEVLQTNIINDLRVKPVPNASLSAKAFPGKCQKPA